MRHLVCVHVCVSVCVCVFRCVFVLAWIYFLCVCKGKSVVGLIHERMQMFSYAQFCMNTREVRDWRMHRILYVHPVMYML